MAARLKSWTNIDVSSVILFFYAKGNTPMQIHQEAWIQEGVITMCAKTAD
jgi:hypothetical protein